VAIFEGCGPIKLQTFKGAPNTKELLNDLKLFQVVHGLETPFAQALLKQTKCLNDRLV